MRRDLAVTHTLLTPDAQSGTWVAECSCGWAYEASEPGEHGEGEVYVAFEQHAERPAELWPRVGQEMLVDCSTYGLPASLARQWLTVKRVLPAWSAGAYPLKADVPGRAEGQWARREVLGVRDPGGEPGVRLTRPMLETLIAMFPEGCDVIAGRSDGQVHAQRLEEKPEAAMPGFGGVLLAEGGGALGITRNTYFALPDKEAP